MIALICLHYLHSPYLSQRAGYDFLWSREIKNINFFEFSESNGEGKRKEARRKKYFYRFSEKFSSWNRVSLLYAPSPVIVLL